MANTKILLKEDKFYHIFNHAVGKENLFLSKDNYYYFLTKTKLYLQNYVDFYAYCLMPNHFHFVVKIKKYEAIKSAYLQKLNSKIEKTKEQDFVSKIVSTQFGHLFNTYAQAFNKENNRFGSLFANRFKRETIDNENYLKDVILYVHNNPVNAGMVSYANEWQFSSYNAIISSETTILERNKVIELYDDLENFKYCNNFKS